MEHIASLAQTLLWVGFLGVVLWRFHKPIFGILEALQKRVERGANIKAWSFELNDQFKPQDAAEQIKKAASEVQEALEIGSEPRTPEAASVKRERATAARERYLQAEDLVLRAIQAEYGTTISRQVTAGSDMGFDGAFVTNGRLNIVEVKHIGGPSGNVSRLRPSLERLANAMLRYGWKNAQIILAVVFERPSEIARAAELLSAMVAELSVSVVVRCFAMSELHRKFGLADREED